MRLAHFYFLKHLLPGPVRQRWKGNWRKLLEWEHRRKTATPEKSERWNKQLQLELLKRETRFYKLFVKPGDLVFDVGANIGVKTAAFLMTGARVVAVEPIPFCLEEIKKLNQRGLAQGTLKIEEVAVAGSRQDVCLTIFEGNSTLTSGSPYFVKNAQGIVPVASRVITVPAVTLDDLIERNGLPDFLKIDVEGMEADILTGLHRKPKFLSFEYHLKPPLWENARRCLMEVQRLGFTQANLTEQDPKLLLDKWIDIKSVEPELRRRFGEQARWGDVIVK